MQPRKRRDSMLLDSLLFRWKPWPMASRRPRQPRAWSPGLIWPVEAAFCVLLTAALVCSDEMARRACATLPGLLLALCFLGNVCRASWTRSRATFVPMPASRTTTSPFPRKTGIISKAGRSPFFDFFGGGNKVEEVQPPSNKKDASGMKGYLIRPKFPGNKAAPPPPPPPEPETPLRQLTLLIDAIGERLQRPISINVGAWLGE
jgi:hypothetical protein